jgi:hypothetical protein
VGGNGAVYVEVRHLSGSVNSGIGTSGGVNGDGVAENFGDGRFEFFLDAAMVGLPLPTVEATAEVLNDDGDALGWRRDAIAHGLDEFENRHFGVIAATVHGTQDAGVTAITIAVAILYASKQRVNELFVVDVAQGLTTSGQSPLFGQGDHALGFGTHGFGTGFGGDDPSVTDQFGGQRTQEGFTLIGRFAELGDATTVTHSWVLERMQDDREKTAG